MKKRDLYYLNLARVVLHRAEGELLTAQSYLAQAGLESSVRMKRLISATRNQIDDVVLFWERVSQEEEHNG